jgi:phenylacetate-CoA ligase
VEVELTRPRTEGADELTDRLARQITTSTGVSAHVRVPAPGTLPRATHKARREDDRRQGVWG